MPMRPKGIGTRPIVGDFTKDYLVASGGYSYGQQRVLLGTQDDLETEISLSTYDTMENDATIAKSKQILLTGTLSDDMQLAPGATEDEVGPEEYKVYVKIMEFCQRCIDGMDRPYADSLWQLLGNAIKYGHAIAETEWEYRQDGDSTKPADTTNKESKPKLSLWERFGYFFGLGHHELSMAEPDAVTKRPTLNSQQTRLMPRAVKVKPRGAARFVVDDYLNVLGLLPSHRYGGTQAGWNEIIDRRKFLVLTMNKRDEDPRGKSMYRAAFNWYNIKSQLPSEILRLVLEEIVPKAVAILSDQAQPFEYERDTNGDIVYEDPDTQQVPKMVTAAESLRQILEQFRSGSGVVLPHGTTFTPFKTGTTGTDADLVAKIIKILDDQMENSILSQTLAQSEGAHQARSASQQVAELLHNLIFWIRRLLATMTLIDLFEVAVQMNFGDWAIRYLPKVSLGDFVRRDWGDDLERLADAYFKGFIDDTQRAELMAWLNLPRPGPSRAELNAQAPAKQDVNGQPIQPNSNRPDKSGAGSGRNNGNGTEKKNVNTKPKQSVSGFSLGNALGHHKRGSGFISRHLFSGRK